MEIQKEYMIFVLAVVVIVLQFLAEITKRAITRLYRTYRNYVWQIRLREEMKTELVIRKLLMRNRYPERFQ